MGNDQSKDYTSINNDISHDDTSIKNDISYDEVRLQIKNYVNKNEFTYNVALRLP